jgi:hypothetical protein
MDYRDSQQRSLGNRRKILPPPSKEWGIAALLERYELLLEQASRLPLDAPDDELHEIRRLLTQLGFIKKY